MFKMVDEQLSSYISHSFRHLWRIRAGNESSVQDLRDLEVTIVRGDAKYPSGLLLTPNRFAAHIQARHKVRSISQARGLENAVDNSNLHLHIICRYYPTYGTNMCDSTQQGPTNA